MMKDAVLLIEERYPQIVEALTTYAMTNVQ